jgi:DNA-binding GntR family transcriptional regulator
VSDSNGWSAFSTLNSVSLPDKIAAVVRAAIVRGRLRAADQVVESRLAKKMGVGQNAVREALHTLEFEGFVRKVPNIGNFVTRLSRSDIDEIFRLRIELESLAVYWAREKDRPNVDDRAQLSKHLDDCETAARVGDFSAYALADTEFHRCLWKTSGSSHLEKCLGLVVVPLLSGALFDSGGPSRLDLDGLIAQHRDWVEALATKPPRLAYIYTRNLLSSFWGQLEKAVAPAPQPPQTQETTAAG